MASPLVFHPGPVSIENAPLGRYLPRLPQGAAAAWLRENLPPGSWVIDPFGASPQLAVEAAQAGYRILVAANNPIAHFMIEMAASPPPASEMSAALADLAAAKRGRERLEPHIRALYTTPCDHCGQEVDALAFLWERDALAPYAREYKCPGCQHTGEFPATEADIQKAAQFREGGPHQARALERVAGSKDPVRQYAEEALEVYLPRAVYVLFTLINKLEGLSLPKDQHDLLAALMLSACDRANTLWQVPSARARPRQLTIPPRFRENNIWLAMEEAIPQWAASQVSTPLSSWPERPPGTGGICLFDGPVRELAPQLGEIELKGLVSALPRQNQAFWTLSALWAGWLWGRQTGSRFTRVLARRRFDWSWHTAALESSLGHLAPYLPTDSLFYGLITESEAGFDAAVMIAADLAEFSLEGLAVRPKSGQTQCLWRRSDRQPSDKEPDSVSIIQAAAQKLLVQIGEPAAYLQLQAASMKSLIEAGALAAGEHSAAELYTEVRSQIEIGLTYRSGFQRYQASEHNFELGKWWPRQPENAQPPLADRVEISLVNRLLDQPGETISQIDTAICAAFTGFQTPGRELVSAILESYGEPDKEGRWRIRSSDAAGTRQRDIREMRAALIEIGGKLGFQVNGENPVIWQPPSGGGVVHFHLTASAVLGKMILNPNNQPGNSLIVLPGGRARLALYKLERDPRMGYLAESGWRFLKFRAVRRMLESPGLTLENLASHLTLDPITQDDPQMPLL